MGNTTDLLVEAQNLLSQRRIPEALKLFDAAEKAAYDPDACAAGRWTCHMLTGQYEAAWRESDAIQCRGHYDPYRFWDGQSLVGRDVILRCLHGLGDTLQFIRYVPLIQAQVRTLTVEVQPKLKSLMEYARIADHIITWGETEPLWNQQIEVNELPRIFRTALSSIPGKTPYLRLQENAPRECAMESVVLRVGLVWAASSFDCTRSIPVETIASLLDLPEIEFYSLQAGSEFNQLQPWADRVKILPGESTCILEVARKMNRMDLIITVDTMTAHLAGALGRRTWTLLPFACDWRWMLNRDDTPWYPTMRLFRQKAPGEWGSVIEHIRKELKELIATFGSLRLAQVEG